MRRLLPDTQPGAALARVLVRLTAYAKASAVRRSFQRRRKADATYGLAGAGRAAALAAAAVFTACVLVLFVPAFRIELVSITARVVLAAVAVMSAWRPGAGLVAVAALVALAEIIGPLLGSGIRNAELLVLSALSGALLRGWWSGAVRSFPRGRLEMAALLFGLVVAASYLEQLWFLQIQRDFPAAVLAGLWEYVQTDYFVGPSIYGGALSSAMLLLEGLALLVWGVRLCRADVRFAHRLMDAVALGGVGAALFTLLHVAMEFAETGASATRFPFFLFGRRWAVHVQDVNAAAAFFGLALFLAGGRALAPGRARGFWMAGTLLAATALLLTHSRTTIVVVLLVAMAALGWAVASRSAWRQARQAAVAMAGLALAFVVSQGIQRGGLGVAVDVRIGFLGTTARMLGWQPMSGVGIGQFSLWSQHFSSPELLSLYRVENAHNNFAQIAGELGLPGLAALVAILAMALVRWRRAATSSVLAWTDMLALVAFIATWFGNHPLLVPAVALPFWIALGAAPEPERDAVAVVPARAPNTRDRRQPISAVMLAVMALLAVSVPLRVSSKSDTVNWTRVSYGFHEWEGEGDRRARWMARRARFHLPPEVAHFHLPVRALVSEEDPMTLDVLIDGRPAARVEMDDWDVRTVDVELSGAPKLGAWQVDLVASRGFVPADVSPESQDTRELSVMIWPIVLFDRADAIIPGEPAARPAQPLPP